MDRLRRGHAFYSGLACNPRLSMARGCAGLETRKRADSELKTGGALCAGRSVGLVLLRLSKSVNLLTKRSAVLSSCLAWKTLSRGDARTPSGPSTLVSHVVL